MSGDVPAFFEVSWTLNDSKVTSPTPEIIVLKSRSNVLSLQLVAKT